MRRSAAIASAGIGDLVTADELGHRQIEQTFRILINHAAMLGVRAVVLAVDVEPRAELIGAARDDVLRFFGLLPDDAWPARLMMPAFSAAIAAIVSPRKS